MLRNKRNGKLHCMEMISGSTVLYVKFMLKYKQVHKYTKMQIVYVSFGI